MGTSSTLRDPKRVILLTKSDISDEDIFLAFLKDQNFPETDYTDNQHYPHYDPDRNNDGKSWLHVVLDMNSATAQDADISTLRHEIFKVHVYGSSRYSHEISPLDCY